jgi:hypothetical protein
MKYNIISIPRSGSGYLRSLISKNLQSNENFYSISEPFNPTKNRSISYEDIITQMSSVDTVITKNHINELIELKNTNEKLYERFFDISFNHVCLLRHDIFETTMSRCIAKLTNQWNEYTYSENDKIVVPEYFFMSELSHTFNMWSAVSQNYFNVEYVNIIYYEELSFNSKKDCELFGIQYNGMDVEYKKSPDKHQLVENIEKLKSLTFATINSISIPNTVSDGLNFSLG